MKIKVRNRRDVNQRYGRFNHETVAIISIADPDDEHPKIEKHYRNSYRCCNRNYYWWSTICFAQYDNDVGDEMGKRWREKNDRFIHDGDCRFWSLDICTCGLLHHLMPNSPDGDYGDWFWEERARHENQMNRVPKPLSYVKPTKEELAERQKLLDEVFPDNEINLEDD